LVVLASGLQMQGLSPEIAKQAGLLKCRYRNVPMGDCMIASTAIVSKAKVLSNNSHFGIVKETRRTWI